MNFNDYVDNLKRKIKSNKKEILFVCIGTSKIIWDSIGPVTGSYLKENIDKELVIGDKKNNIICNNDLIYYFPKIKDKFIIAIDAAVASEELSGEIFINNKPLIMGLGVNNNKGIIGNVSIKVAVTDKVSREYVQKKASFIAKGICQIF